MQIEINRITGCFVPTERSGVVSHDKKVEVDSLILWFVILMKCMRIDSFVINIFSE